MCCFNIYLSGRWPANVKYKLITNEQPSKDISTCFDSVLNSQTNLTTSVRLEGKFSYNKIINFSYEGGIFTQKLTN